MSLFRKPTKKIQRRVFTADDDDDGEPEPPPPPVISCDKKENKPAKIKVPHLLSFADEEEEEEIEVFKVKKSSQSKRLAKRREKEKRLVPDGDNYQNDIADNEVKPAKEKSKGGKKVTLEGLILSGRSALSASGAGDVSDSGGSSGSADERGFHRYRADAVRAALADAAIPDAALIHAARKTRQQARELGDFVPLRTDGETEATRGAAGAVRGRGRGRLVREDASGDEEDEGPIRVVGLELPSDKPQRGTAAEPTNEELDSDAEQWEEQQLHKAVPAIVDLCDVELNPFAVAPPPPRLEDAPAHLRPLAAAGDPAPADAAQLCAALDKRLEELEVHRSELLSRSEELRSRLLTASRVQETSASRRGQLDRQYRRAQAVRGYLTDLIECLDEKIPQIEALEARALALHKKRCEFLIERRRADVRDQAQDVMAAPAGRPGAPKSSEDEDKVRRTAEREGRRRARRLQREATNSTEHLDGDSSDDELSPSETHRHRVEREEIQAASAALFSDALGAFGSARGVCRQLARWRRAAPELYGDAYVAACLPRLLAPYVRHQLILWNPLADEDNEDYEKMDWYKCAVMYGVKTSMSGSESDSDSNDDALVTAADVTEDTVRNDPDLMLVPNLVAKVVVPKLTELVEAAYDPQCVRASVRLRGMLLRAAAVPRAQLAPLSRAAAARLIHALRADVMLPPPTWLAPGGVTGGGGAVGAGGEAFWRRCLGAGVRLLRSSLALTPPPPALAADHIVARLVDMLCSLASACDGRRAAMAASAMARTLPRAGPLRTRCLARLAALAQRALLDLADNPLHLQSIDQARSIIAEAKVANENTNHS